MRKRILPIILGVLFLTNLTFAQGVCGSYKGYLQDEIDKYPDFYKSLEQQNAELEKSNKTLLQNIVREKSTEGKKIIPVVVHVVYNEKGEGAITDSEVQYAIDHLNANINGQAYNFLTGTPDVFAASRGELNVEFRLAKLTPKCDTCTPRTTTGIVRIQSELTNLPENGNNNIIKTLSYWNSYQYLNIWLAADIPGLNGYAQFPATNLMSTDGVVIRTSTFKTGKTITHEVGHWLDLSHTWGNCGYDPPQSCCGGDDGIYDTPNDKVGGFDATTGSFPHNVDACPDPLNPNPAGEMFMNYMDYISDSYQTMFTKNQVDKMNETLEGTGGEFGWREYMWSEENIAATGTADGYVGPICSMKGEIWNGFPTSSICEGTDVWLKSNKNQFVNLTSLSWDLGDNGAGTYNPADPNNELYQYAAPGSYDVTAIFEYNETTESKSSSLSDLDTVNATSWEIVTNTIIVQGTESELIAMGAINIVEHQLDSALDNNNWVDSIGAYWGFQDTSFFRGEVEETIYVAYYTNTCTSTTTKTDFITVLPTTATNNESSYSYSFEDASDLNGDWVVNTTDNQENIWDFISFEDNSWEHASGVASYGESCIKMAAKDGNTLSTSSLVSSAYNLSGFTNPAIKFSWSGAAVNTFPVNELNVYYSNDCGEDWQLLGSLTDSEVANAGLYNSNFIPKNDEWNDSVMYDRIGVNALLNDNIRFKFEYVTNGSSNNFYIDNIQIGEETSLLQTLDNNAKLAVYPNPTSGLTNILMENLADKDVQVKLMNILGADVKLLFDGSVISKYQTFDTDLSQFEDGIYFISAYSEGKAIITDKIILFK